MKYFAFLVIFFVLNLFMSNFTRMFEDNFFRLPSNVYLYFILTSIIYFIFYNLIPGSIIFFLNENFTMPKLFQILLLSGSTFFIGLAFISFGGLQEMQIGRVQLITDGRATLAYHVYNWTMVIIPYVVSIYFISMLYPSGTAGVADG
jgi:hypothetical protein